MDFLAAGCLALVVTGNSPALAQAKFDRSDTTFKVEEHPGVFCNGALVLGARGSIEYTAPIADALMEKIQKWAFQSNGIVEVDGRKYPFAVNCLTKSQVLHLPLGQAKSESRQIAEGWASMQLTDSISVDREFDWSLDPAFQVNLLLKSRSDLVKEHPDLEADAATMVGKIQTALLDDLESSIGKISESGYQGKHVLQPWCETNIVRQGVNKGQSLNRFIHCKTVRDTIGQIDVGRQVMVAGDAANDLPMFLEWAQVDDFNGEKLARTSRPAIRAIMPDSDDEKLQVESNVRNKCYEVVQAVLHNREEVIKRKKEAETIIHRPASTDRYSTDSDGLSEPSVDAAKVKDLLEDAHKTAAEEDMQHMRQWLKKEDIASESSSAVDEDHPAITSGSLAQSDAASDAQPLRADPDHLKAPFETMRTKLTSGEGSDAMKVLASMEQSQGASSKPPRPPGPSGKRSAPESVASDIATESSHLPSANMATSPRSVASAISNASSDLSHARAPASHNTRESPGTAEKAPRIVDDTPDAYGDSSFEEST
jgi:hydroxymethylpyrimidine pyrophosphatase-like HAD family hydrolase